MIFGIHTTRDISKLSQILLAKRTAREITYNNFEISLQIMLLPIQIADQRQRIFSL